MSLRTRVSKATQALLGREERAPLPFEMYQSYGLSPLFSTGTPYGDNPWLGGAVDRIARELARTKFHLQIERDGEIEIIKKHQALDTLRFPQPTKTPGKSLLSNMDLKLVTGYHLCLEGDAYWLLDKRMRTNGAPTYIDILNPRNVRMVVKDGELQEYIYRLPDRDMHLRPEDVVHFKLPDPMNWNEGHPPVKSIRYSLDMYKEADITNLRKIQNGAVPSGTLETDQPVNDEERKKILQQWNERYGGSSNAGKTAMLPKGLHFNRTQETNQDMQWIEGKQMNKTEILARYGVGPEILGLTESQTRANAEAAIYVFMKFGASFFIEKFADTLNNDYLPVFPGTEGMEMGYPDPVPENMEEKRLNAQTLWSMGGLSPNQARQLFGMEAETDEGMDSKYLDMGKIPINAPPLTL
jgi:HK97 family phage portal protein